MSVIDNIVFDHTKIKNDFPILRRASHGKPLVYLDSGATTQKPNIVIDAINDYYTNYNANIHRGIYELSQLATGAYEAARQNVRHFINARHNDEIIFTKGTTDAINLVAFSFGEAYVQEGDEIVISEMEHHSNIVPWQLLCERKRAKLKVISVNDDGTLDLDQYRQLLNDKTKIVSVIHVSNVLGTVNPVKEMIKIAHQQEIPVLLDGAQALPHIPVDVQALDCDFYAFSSHKLYGPTGTGVLYGKSDLLESMPPYQSGGDMISRVTFEKTEYNALPHKFEAGTPNMAGVIGLGAAIDYLNKVGMDNLVEHENELLLYATDALQTIPGLKIIGNAPNKIGVISFVMESAHPHDIGTILDSEGVAIRAGHHCAMPLIDRFGLAATARASFGLYNQIEDIDRLLEGLHKVNQIFGD